MFKRSQVLAVCLGSAIHLIFWAYEIATSGRPDWLCGENGCWTLIIADKPFSRLYAVSNQSVTWGSLFLGSLWWGILAAGIASVAWLLGFVVSASCRASVGRALSFSRLRSALYLTWWALSIASLLLYAKGLSTWLGPT